MSLHKHYWENKITLCHKTFSGYSRSAYRTGFCLNDLDLYFDAGLSTFSKVHSVLITHGHGDHVFSLGSFCFSDNKVAIYAPEKSIPYLEGMLLNLYTANFESEAAGRHYLNLHAEFRPIKLAGLSYGQAVESFRVEPKPKQLYEIRPYRLDHSISTCGYGVSVIKKKLNPVLSGLGLSKSDLSKVIRALKSGGNLSELLSSEQIWLVTGIDVSVEVSEPELIYLTDTTVKFLDVCADVWQYPNIIIECTFLSDEDLDEVTVKGKKHIHIDQLIPHIKSHPDNHFILIHFSQKYTDDTIMEILREKISDSLKVTAWLDRGPESI